MMYSQMSAGIDGSSTATRPNATAIEARAIRIRPIGRDGKPGKPRDVKVTASIGIAERSDKRKTPKEVITAADKALYKAKGAGRNRVMRG